MKKRLSLFVVFILAISVFFIRTFSVGATTETDRITEQITTTYSKALSLRGWSTFKKQCDDCVKYQLMALGITSSSDKDVWGNGNAMYGNITEGKTSTGYIKTKYSGNDCLYDLINANTGNVYNIVVSWSHSHGASDSNPGAGHVMFIHAIIDDTVYFSDNYKYSGTPEGMPLVMSLSDFMSKWNVMYGNAVGAVHFTKNIEFVMTSLVIESMPDKVYYPVGGIFDRNGLTARVTYSDGYTKLLYPEHLKFSNTDFTEPGIQFIRADYYGIYTSFPVVVYSEFPEKESQTAIPADRNLYVDFKWSVTDMNGMLITKDSLSGSTGVIIFFKATGDCYNSNQTIKSIAASEWVKNDKVQVVAVDVTGSDNETVTEYKNTYAAECDDIIFAKDTTGALSKFKNELGLNNTVAANIITDESGAVRYAWTGNYNADYYQNALANIVDGINSTGDMSYYDICVKGEYDYDMANAVFENINKYRIDLGLSTLKMNKELSESAMKRAAELSIIYSHTRPDYSNCFSILPVEFQSSTMRENIAAGYVTADDVASAWMNSYGHNKNIIASDNISTGIGCFCHNGKYYWVQMFSAEDTIAQSVELSGVECVSVDMKTTGSMLNLNAQLSSENLTVGNSSAIVLNHTNTEFYSALTLLEPTFVESSSPDVASVAISSTGTFVTAKTEGSAILRIGFVSEQGTETVVEVLVNVTEPSTDDEYKPTQPANPSIGDEDKPTEPTNPSTGDEDEPTNPVVTGLLGDANEDGKVNIKDATLIQKSIANLTELTETGEALADADLNTKINIKDATAIQKFVAKIETGFPVGEPIVSKVND